MTEIGSLVTAKAGIGVISLGIEMADEGSNFTLPLPYFFAASSSIDMEMAFSPSVDSVR